MYEFDNGIALLFFTLFYFAGALIFAGVTNNMFDDNPTKPFFHLYWSKSYFENNRQNLLAVLSITWPVSWFFMWGCCFGNEIYRMKIIKNEEDRIAAWFV